MKPDSQGRATPRKSPQQARSRVTIDAIFEAALQVLLLDGGRQLTTTRVAERAGVSVGTLYQYFQNKQVLLYAVLGRHIDRIVESVEATCVASHGQPLDVMARSLAKAYVGAKMTDIEEAQALYRLSEDLDGREVFAGAATRMHAATVAMLKTAREAHFDDPETVAFVFLNSMSGPIKAILENRAPPGACCETLAGQIADQIATMCGAYLARVAQPVAPKAAA
ncbi:MULTISPECIES: TetR/AcrR family transcriptional regulator [Pandoraea]|uniref:TetR/AcrR family transcriptional regulator n=1 Tax=Pandoraea communis TaxID=2508297 RepID=A0A5E4WB82_9BURK|nr:MULTISPECIES: TetR/AcrR family transcriptional regulator [Pandoraea]EON15585.1 TetR family transcriptional regulator [Pandoraea sp. SD6-2]VVE20365.1 TetR/AcrR family transcriptional regulator [Pandoraea communis]